MASLFSTPLFLLEDQVLLFVSVYDIFLLPAVVRNSIGAMCHAMVMSWILAPSQPGPPPSLPQGYTLSLHLTFQINLLYCISCLEDLLSTSFQPCKLWLWQYALLSKCFKIQGKENVKLSMWPIHHSRSICYVQDIFKISHFTSQRGSTLFFAGHPPNLQPSTFSTIGGSLFWRLEFTKYQNSTPHNMRHCLTRSLGQVLFLPCGSWEHRRSWELPQQACRSPRRHRSSPSGLPRLEPSSLLQNQQRCHSARLSEYGFQRYIEIFWVCLVHSKVTTYKGYPRYCWIHGWSFLVQSLRSFPQQPQKLFLFCFVT